MLTETAVREWVRQADVDAGRRDGLTTAEREEVARLRKENRIPRVLLVAPRTEVVAFAVATDPVALKDSLQVFSARCSVVVDYDEVAYHFWVDREGEGDS